MKKINLLPIILLSLFLLNCGKTGNPGKVDKAIAPNSGENPLIKSVKNEQLKDTMSRLSKGIQLEDPDFLLLALDEEADEETQIKILDFLISHAKNRTSQQDIHPVVFQAIEKNKNQVVKFLLNRVSINYTATDKDRTLLHAAVATASKDTVETLLLKNGKLINAKSPTHGTPLHYLLEVPFKLDGKSTNDIATRKKILELLLQNGKINLTIKNRNNHTAAQLADILARENGDAAKTANATLKATYSERQKFYEWAANEIKVKASSKH